MNPNSQNKKERGDADDVNVKGILIFLLILVVLVAGALLTVRVNFALFTKRAERADAGIIKSEVSAEVRSSRSAFPAPREQAMPRLDLKDFRAREDAELNTYGWVDQKSGIVRIPIERAMDLVIARGLPTRSGTNESEVGPSRLQMQQQRATELNPTKTEEKQ